MAMLCFLLSFQPLTCGTQSHSILGYQAIGHSARCRDETRGIYRFLARRSAMQSYFYAIQFVHICMCLHRRLPDHFGQMRSGWTEMGRGLRPSSFTSHYPFCPIDKAVSRLWVGHTSSQCEKKDSCLRSMA
ncbi:hypothetical protein CPB83DRAFT_676549 [Crepidotus variabilis]|uniref:Secreted protein n=1 Tax=Crepidotus variabilis TaxID=179855 RepID=A0A9P6EP15_9AGAR|nr:hypothetical protein CPB83DRAFT_676549 [Crepidotus variabilis]